MTSNQQATQSYQDLFNSVEDAILIQNRDGKFIDVNDGAVQMYGYSKEEILGENPYLFGDEELNDLEETAQYFYKAFEGETQKFEFWARSKQGTLIPTEVILNSGTYFGESVVYAIARDITDRKENEQRITSLKEFYEDVLNELPTELAVFNTEAEYIYINPAAISSSEIRQQMLGRTSEEYAAIKGRDPEPYRQRTQWIKKAIRRKKSDSIVEQLEDDQGNEHYIQRWIYPVIDQSGEVKRVLGYGVDITDLKKATAKLKNSLHEKNILLQEIHHRVKNNLAIVTGLMQLQLYNYGDDHPEIQSILKDSTSRIQSMGVIHDQLYQSGNLTQVEFGTYIETLVGQIRDTFWSSEKPLDLELNTESINLNINQAVPCGLLLNEILTNAFKHAFTDHQQDACITIDISKSNESIQMRISDNGVGLPEDMEQEEPESLGLNMVDTLTTQLEASLDIISDSGVTYEIQFQKQQTSGSSSSLTNMNE